MSSKFTREVFLSVCSEVIRYVDTQIKTKQVTKFDLADAIAFIRSTEHFICMITRPYGCKTCKDGCDSFNTIANKAQEYSSTLEQMESKGKIIAKTISWPDTISSTKQESKITNEEVK